MGGRDNFLHGLAGGFGAFAFFMAAPVPLLI
jgi:hypothetical protein